MVDDVGVDVRVDVAAPGIEPADGSGRSTVLEVGSTGRTVVVVLTSARSAATIDGSGGLAARAGAHDAQHRIPTVRTARRKGLTGP